jgi:hypothetical protein
MLIPAYFGWPQAFSRRWYSAAEMGRTQPCRNRNGKATMSQAHEAFTAAGSLADEPPVANVKKPGPQPAPHLAKLRA